MEGLSFRPHIAGYANSHAATRADRADQDFWELGPKYEVGQLAIRSASSRMATGWSRLYWSKLGRRRSTHSLRSTPIRKRSEMYAVAFDLVVADTLEHHPKGLSRAYADIGRIMHERGFERVQGSLYVTPHEDMANLFMAIQELRSQPWFPSSVRDIRGFRIEQWSDFTAIVKTTE